MNDFSHLLSTWFQVIDLKPLHLSAHKFCSKQGCLEVQFPSPQSQSPSPWTRLAFYAPSYLWGTYESFCGVFCEYCSNGVGVGVLLHMSVIYLLWSFIDEETGRFSQMCKIPTLKRLPSRQSDKFIGHMGVILTHRSLVSSFIYSSLYNYDGGKWEDLQLKGLLQLLYLQKRETAGWSRCVRMDCWEAAVWSVFSNIRQY